MAAGAETGRDAGDAGDATEDCFVKDLEDLLIEHGLDTKEARIGRTPCGDSHIAHWTFIIEGAYRFDIRNKKARFSITVYTQGGEHERHATPKGLTEIYVMREDPRFKEVRSALLNSIKEVYMGMSRTKRARPA